MQSPDGGTEDPGLGERSVNAPIRAVSILQARRRTENAAESTDVLAQDHDRRVALHLDVERVVHCLDE